MKKTDWVWLTSGVLFLYYLFSISSLPFLQTNDPSIYFLIGIWIFMNGILVLVRISAYRFPEKHFNVPNREYWLATPERKVIFREKAKVALAWSGLFINLVLIYFTYLMNHQGQVSASFHIPFVGGIIAIPLGTIGLMVAVSLYFREPD